MPTLYDNLSQVRQFIDENNSSYVSKTELANASYVTSTALSNMGYITSIPSSFSEINISDSTITDSELTGDIYINDIFWNDLVTKEGLSANSYATTSQIPVINESIIPKENNTYTLGNNSYLYAATYSSQLNVGNNSKVYNDSGGITFSVNGNNGLRIGSNALYPKTNKGYNIGSSSNIISATYTTNIYTENVSYTSSKSSIKLNDRNVDIWANNKKMVNVSDYNGVIPTQTNVNLGGSSNKWAATYTTDLYVDSSTYLPKNTYWYDGSSYHWLGDLF